MPRKIISRAHKHFGIVSRIAEHWIAVAAKKLADLAAAVAMIHRQQSQFAVARYRLTVAADCAFAILSGEHLVISLKADAEIRPQRAIPDFFRMRCLIASALDVAICFAAAIATVDVTSIFQIRNRAVVFIVIKATQE